MNKEDINKMLKSESEFKRLIIIMASELRKLSKKVDKLMRKDEDK